MIDTANQKMHNVVLFTGKLDKNGTGREKFRSQTYKSLKVLYPDLSVFQFAYDHRGQIQKYFSLRLDGLSAIDKEGFKQCITGLPPGAVAFVDGSNYGLAVARLKTMRPDVKVITLFHNVESVFFIRAFKRLKRVKSLALSLYYYLQEYMVARHSNICVFLTEEDNKIFSKWYPKVNSAILPISVECTDKPDPSLHKSSANLRLLFVGGAFYANVEAAFWLRKHLEKHKNVELTIVGKGFDKIEGLVSENVQVLGFVKSLSTFYGDADIVLNPIFSGSGMKTKVAEALCFGKPICSTPMGMHGYEDIISREYLTIFSNEDEFNQLLMRWLIKKENNSLRSFYPQAVKDYEMYYSSQAYENRLKELIEF